jgi:hypothetical protein
MVRAAHAGAKDNGTVARRPVRLADRSRATEPEIVVPIELKWPGDVQLAGDVCCGRSLISKGLLDEARQRHCNSSRNSRRRR